MELGGAALGGRRRSSSVRQRPVQRKVHLRQEEGGLKNGRAVTVHLKVELSSVQVPKSGRK